jgi:type II secretory pathway pseudopilin PulG
LIELLAVLLILSILVGALMVVFGDSQRAVQRRLAEQLLVKVEAAVKHYEADNGRAPSSSFQGGQEVGNDGLNVGIEALIVALFSKKYEAGGLLNDLRDQLINSDGDRATKALTDFETRDLLEVPDPWGNPIAYIERADYGVVNRRYQTIDPKTGETLQTAPLAFKNKATGQYYSAQGFQLISAGEDARFGTEDDITAFQRE